MPVSLAHIHSGTPMGANLVADGATFRIWAPKARSVHVIGDFNNPTLRWPSASTLPYETMFGMLLYEVLRFAYFPRRLEELSRLYDVDVKNPAIPFPPDLLAALELKKESAASGSPLFVYPDPPLSTEEMRLVREFALELNFTTPTMMPLMLGRGGSPH